MSRVRICLIGAGPSGLSTLYHFADMEDMPEVVCYEKQKTWLGLWNVSWKTGLDENGEPVHTSMYKYMWANGPKEMHEFHDYPFDVHYKKPTPSFPSLVVFRDYLEGRFTNSVPRGRNLKDYIQFNTAVRFVKYIDEKGEFIVTINDYNTGKTREETFTHVIVATGIFSFPNLPEFPGMNDFTGPIIHSHDFRDGRIFTGKRVLIIGAGYTGEDLVLQCLKFGAKHVILAYRTRPKSATCIMPEGVEERPNLERFDSTKAYFKDGSSAEMDCVVLSTGYRNYFPFLEDRFRIDEKTNFYPEGLYKGTLFYKEGNNRLFYIGALSQIYTFIYFEVLAKWTCKYIMGQLPDEPKKLKEMEADSQIWLKRINACRSEIDVVRFQTALISHLAELSGYHNDISKRGEMLEEFLKDRGTGLGLANYRDRCYTSICNGSVGLKQSAFMQNFDESVEAFVKSK